MKIRSYLKSKKTTNILIPKQSSSHKNSSKTKIKHFSDNQLNIHKELSCEQKAYHTLIQQSWNEQAFKHFQKNQPDAFLKITPRLKQRDKQELKIIGKEQKFNSSIKKPDNQRNNSQQNGRTSKTQQSHSSTNKIKKNVSINSNYSTNINNHLFVGKEVLCLTQYMISGPQWRLNSVDCPRKLQRSKYIRVLKQMKSRNYKKVEEKKSQSDKISVSISGTIDSKKNHKQQPFFTMSGTTTVGLQKIFLSNNKTKRDQRTQSLRTTLNNHHKRQLDYNFSNRFQ